MCVHVCVCARDPVCPCEEVETCSCMGTRQLSAQLCPLSNTDTNTVPFTHNLTQSSQPSNPTHLGSHPLWPSLLTPTPLLRFLLVPFLVPDQQGYLWMASGSSHSPGPLCADVGWALGPGGRERSQEWPGSCCCASLSSCGIISICNCSERDFSF